MMRRVGWSFLLTVALPLSAACGSDEGDGVAGPTVGTGGGSAAGAGGSGASAASSGTGGSGAGIQLGGAGGTDGGAQTGCTKTDFLFVVDSSVSMGNEQAALTAAFPKFIASIQGATKIKDYHIMVVDTDAETRCTTSACAGTPHSTCNNYACNHVYKGCDATRGAGVIQPTGQGSSNKVCPIDGGIRYMTESQTDLTGTFSCVATLGLAGHPSERPMEAMVAAVSPAMNDQGGCNEGFLRKDAILVVTFISDDPNKEDTGTPKEWYDAVVAAKGGKPESVVMLGLIPDGAAANPAKQLHWHDFIALWGTRGLKGDVESTDYAPFFDNAIGIIDDTCNNFIPPPR
ncbi:MAG: hypothetical protein R3B13_09575 [Polyangiaceae bacterium]